MQIMRICRIDTIYTRLEVKNIVIGKHFFSKSIKLKLPKKKLPELNLNNGIPFEWGRFDKLNTTGRVFSVKF